MRDQKSFGRNGLGFLMADSAIRERQMHEIPLFGATPEELNAIFDLSLRRTQGEKGGAGPLSAVLQPMSVALFLGQGRSGHSLVGALLDAHADCLIAHELNVCGLIAAGFNREQIYYLIWENSRHFAKVGRAWGKYSYAVPGAHQGQFRRLSVIGDKKGGSTADYFHQNPSNVDRTAAFFGVPLRFVHVVRNPLDNIAAMALQMGGTIGLDGAIENYTRRCVAAAQLLETRPDDVITLHHEDVLSRPRLELTTLAERLGLAAEPAWLDACVAVIRAAPSRSRNKVNWSLSQRAAIHRLVAQHGFLQRYESDMQL
jgi:hypothetical protein